VDLERENGNQELAPVLSPVIAVRERLCPQESREVSY